MSFPRHKAIDLLRRAIQASSSAYWNYNTARVPGGPWGDGGKPELVMRPLSKIVIVGGGTSGWLAASMLCQHLKRELCEIELVESEELGTIGVGESTVPPFVGLIQRLGIDEAEFVRATDGTYKLGIKFVGWHERSDSYFHPFGVIGKPIGNHDFYQCWLKARAAGRHVDALQDFSPCNVMAEQGRFFHPAKARNTPIGGANYALHVDALLVTKFLRKYAEERGLKRTEGKVVEVAQRDDGFIESVTLASGQKIDGDFFIDCTGFKSLLIGKTLGVENVDWSNYLPCDRAVVCKTENKGALRAVHARHGAAGGLELAHSAASSASAMATCTRAASRAMRRRAPRCCVRSTPRASKSRASFRTPPGIAASSGSTTACRWVSRPGSSSRSRRRRST